MTSSWHRFAKPAALGFCEETPPMFFTMKGGGRLENVNPQELEMKAMCCPLHHARSWGGGTLQLPLRRPGQRGK